MDFFLGFLVGVMVQTFFYKVYHRPVKTSVQPAKPALVQPQEPARPQQTQYTERQLCQILKMLKTANAMSLEINELAIHRDMPNKNQMHSLYKNRLSDRIRMLFDEREVLLKKLWDSGFNPMIPTQQADGSIVKKHLRDVLKNTMEDSPEPLKPEDKKPRLTIVRD